MTCTRQMHDLIEAVSNNLGKAVAHHHADKDMAFFYIEKAQKVMDELRREIFLATHRSGEVR